MSKPLSPLRNKFPPTKINKKPNSDSWKQMPLAAKATTTISCLSMTHQHQASPNSGPNTNESRPAGNLSTGVRRS